jgi:hypothetical protein
MSANDQNDGSCLCGEIEFVVSLPSKWCAHCHCSMCRKAHGAGYVTWIGFEQQQVVFTNGEDQVGWYQSSSGAERGFCRKCGSTMFFRSQQWAGELHIAVACLNGKLDRQPQANVFFDKHVDWMPIDDSLKEVGG